MKEILHVLTHTFHIDKNTYLFSSYEDCTTWLNDEEGNEVTPKDQKILDFLGITFDPEKGDYIGIERVIHSGNIDNA